MADTAIFDLTPETVMTAAHEFVVQDTSAATVAQAATFALVGGLEIDSTYNSAADHADTTLTATGKLHLVDLSAMTSNFVPKLPVAANVNTGECVGFFITATHATFELSLQSGAASDLINGVDAGSGTEWSRIWQVGEQVVFQCINGTTGDWRVMTDGRIPCLTHIEPGTDTAASEAANTWTDIDLASATVQSNVGAIADVANDRVNIRRAGNYTIGVNGRPLSSVTDANYYSVGFHTATGNAVTKQLTAIFGNTTQAHYLDLTVEGVPFAVGDTVYFKYRSQEGSKGFDALAQFSFMSVREIF